MNALLVLEDGTIFEGTQYGIPGKVHGEVVFHTGVVGYQEILTDPVYAGQIVVLTYPLIGNYGVNEEDSESDSVWPKGLIIHEGSPIFSNFRATGSLDDFLERNKVICLKDVDTRALAIHLREHGEMCGIISTDEENPDHLIDEIKSMKSPYSQDLTESTSCKNIIEDKDDLKYLVAVLDLGFQRSILTQLNELDCSLIRIPPSTSADKIIEQNPDGILISSGPGDPGKAAGVVEQVKGLIGKVPVFGIGLGHQILALASGGRVSRLKLGHRGVNIPVVEEGNRQSLITSQHHSFCVEAGTLPNNVEITHMHLNDKTIEGISFKDIPAFSIQFYPSRDEFDKPSKFLQKFVEMMKGNKSA